ncbi:hypothetical protein M406DRAFT_296100 [Cryphonectria parasitica EP155]|uniref:Uncharacterized protein n=1 Tax=Cryphonectria parasitica (strain ATCC 38755 / EP155) TaxID=660469 RepID=A0A9P4XTW3_CRYP1|nr:uncharacterized protein M406DRAFT_296100 [Cryphonectria parasitica EP155]KAF3760690.1 hypothetical protein M406DRAFT_296100 [Cryphonectria parasitica EP155]
MGIRAVAQCRVATDHVNMDQEQRMQEIHILDMTYQDTMHQTDLVVKDEEARRLKLRVVVLQDEVAALRDQLTNKISQISHLSEKYDEIYVHLDHMNQTCISQEAQLRSQTRQQSELKAELLCASNMSDNTAKTLAEKLALSRELAVLKPEIDHLRSQLSHQKDVLAEKLALERQLNTLEVELANEKRATQKALQRNGSQDREVEDELRLRVAELEEKLATEQRAAEKANKTQSKAQSSAEDKLRQQVGDLEKKLADEQKASDKANKMHQKVQSDVEGDLRQQMLTQRIEEFKGKLRETRGELKEARAELTQTRTTTTNVPIKADDEPKKPLSKAQAGKKRRVNEISVDDMMLDTPGHLEGKTKRPLKKRAAGLELTTLGEKSTFSITPFLNKSNTITLSETIEEEAEEPSILEGKGDPAAPIIEPEAELAEEVFIADKQPAKSVAKALKASKPKPSAADQKKARGRPKAPALAEASPNKPVATSSSSTLDKITEETEATEKENASTEDVNASKKPLPTVTSSADTSNASSHNPEPKKKKRKLLGASNKGTLFDKDEDAGEADPSVPTVATATTKRKPMGIKAARKGPVASLARGAFPRKSFSPLKKDRRGVGASFLA